VTKSVDNKVNEASSTDRREMLKKLGRFGTYTAPVMIAAFATSKAASASEGKPDQAW
jgi:hypothetical protein